MDEAYTIFKAICEGQPYRKGNWTISKTKAGFRAYNSKYKKTTTLSDKTALATVSNLFRLGLA